MITVHMIGNAHIDPVWLWRWTAGVVEVLSTCRAAADLLDAQPGLRLYPRRGLGLRAGRAPRPRRCSPASGARSQAAAGRSSAAGGSSPTATSPRGVARQADGSWACAGSASASASRPDVAYNVDSFGHTAFLPSLMREHGFASYVMMRPGAAREAAARLALPLAGARRRRGRDLAHPRELHDAGGRGGGAQCEGCGGRGRPRRAARDVLLRRGRPRRGPDPGADRLDPRPREELSRCGAAVQRPAALLRGRGPARRRASPLSRTSCSTTPSAATRSCGRSR